MISRRVFLGVALAAPALARDPRNLLVCTDERGVTRPVRSPRDWELRRESILENLQKVTGPLPSKPRATPEVRVLEETRAEGFLRRKIAYRADADDWVPAFLLLPSAGKSGRRPAALCLHQTTRIGKAEPAGLGGSPNLHYAAELAARGFVALAPDYPNFGDYSFDPYAHGYVSATMKGIWNHLRAVDLLVSLPEVHPKRIGAIGHSLGGHNTLFAGVFEPRLRALVTSCGFNAFPKYMRGDLTGWSHKGYMPRIATDYGKDPARMPFDFPEILAALAPRAVFINAPLGDANFEVSGVRDCVEAARPVYERIFGRAGKLVAVYPDAQHDFPTEVRREAYQFLNRELA